jgi:ABC-2 type transport system ATP-binding protein
MNYIEVQGLTKTYPTFKLNQASMILPMGYIMGFIGENGAGKTTFLRTMLNLTNRESGTIKLLGKDMYAYEVEIKQEIGFMSGDAIFYPKSKLSSITKAFRLFYKNWDEALYQRYLQDFNLDESKRINELSQGMRIKYNLALALSHQAKLLILDEPTSGLDPVAREMLLEVFQSIVEQGDVSILFSTHITSDLEKCADFITMIQNGRILMASTKDDLIDSFYLVSGSHSQLEKIQTKLVSYKSNTLGFTGLIASKDANDLEGFTIKKPTLDDIIIYHSTYRGVHHA